MKLNYAQEISHKKAEINSAIERYHSTVTFMITTVLAILTFGVSAHSSIITFFALIANTLLWGKATVYKNVMAQHSAYCQVFLENSESGFIWETVNQRVSAREQEHKQRSVNRYIEWEAIGMNVISLVVTVLLTVFANIKFEEWSIKTFVQCAENISWIQAVFLGITIITFLLSCLKVMSSKNVHELRCHWIKIFEIEKAAMEDEEKPCPKKAEKAK